MPTAGRNLSFPRVGTGAVVALVVLASLLAMLATAGMYLRTTVLSAEQFGDRAAATLAEQPVRNLVATEVTDRVILEAEGDLVAFRPVIQSAVAGVIGSSPFRSLFSAAVADFHRTAIDGDGQTATLLLADIGLLLGSALGQNDSRVAELLPDRLEVSLPAGDAVWSASDGWAAAAIDLADLAPWIALLAVALFAVAVAISADRRRALIAASLGLASTGALLFALIGLLRSDLIGGFVSAEDQAVAGVIWENFFGDLSSWALMLFAAGLIVAAALASLLRPVSLGQVLERAWRAVLTTPERTGPKLIRAFLFVVVGLLLVLETEFMLEWTALVAGGLLGFHGLQELLRLIAPEAEGPEAEERRRQMRRRVGRGASKLALAAVAAGLLIVSATAFFASGAIDPPKLSSDTSCNGDERLCDRTLDQVAFATTHNSMAAQTIPRWNFPQQEREIDVQLAEGVRGLMIDAYFGRPVDGRVLTEIDRGKLQRHLVENLGKEGAAAAARIRDRLLAGGGEQGPRGLWLCHGICEVGAIPMKESLTQIRDFLAGNPREVVILTIQDEGPGPADIEAEFERTGLLPYVYEGPVDGDLPTLREMIDTGGRLLVVGENDAGDPAVPWYHDAFELMRETPFHFTSPDQFSCRANRGREDAPLFLLNHWIDSSPTPQPSWASKVNRLDVLLGRAEECAEIRGLLPNLIAVDFYRRGDLFGVVDRLNRRPD